VSFVVKSVLVDEDPYRLESPHRPLRSADELAGEAGRFREPITDGAGKDDPLRGAPVDQVTDTGEDRVDAVCVHSAMPITSPPSINGATAPRRDPGSRCVPTSRLLTQPINAPA
jgi:hypothetical protein